MSHRVATIFILLLIETLVSADEKKDSQPSAIYASSTTIIIPRQVLDLDDPAHKMYEVPFYEYITLGADNLRIKGFSVHLSGFAMAHILKPSLGTRATGDILIGTLTYESPKSRVFSRLGRQIIYEAQGNNVYIDGVFLRAKPLYDFEISAWAGLIPYRQFDLSADRPAFGGRIAYNRWDIGHIGLSYAGERDQSEFARSALGIDYGFRYFRFLDVYGYATFDPLIARFSEVKDTVSFIMDKWWRFSLDYSFYIPSARIPKTSIFSIFTDRQFHSVGGEVSFRGESVFSGHIFGRFFYYEQDELGYHVGIKPVLDFSSHNHLAGLEVSRLKGGSNAYVQLRLFGIYKPVEKLYLVGDIDNYFYDKDVQGYKRSNIFAVDAGYEVFKKARLQGGLSLVLNPRFEQQLFGQIKFSYDFSYLKK